jgi:hypothetical protein
MLETRADLESELVSQLQVAANSSLFPSTRITELIRTAYKKATELFIWNDLVKAMCTRSFSGYEYYDYPDEFRSGTIIRLEMDDEPYERKNFEDYLEYKHQNSSSTEKLFSSFGRQYFIWPIPTTTGTDNITICGAVVADPLDDATDETIFTNNNEDCNLAVVGLALSIALKRVDAAVSKKEEESAIATLGRHNAVEQATTQRDKRIQHPRFSVPNYFSGRSRSHPVGGFNVGGY